MKWSWKIGRFAGIDVQIHATFWLILVFVAWSHWSQGQTLGGVIEGVVFVLAIFLCVVLHEFGHALTARRFGIRTRDITLLPIGGLARLERMPDEPIQELWVALAGPAVNVVIAVLLLGWLFVTSALEPLGDLTLTSGPFLERLMITNIFLVVFNMIPAFPMDGGRVLRALLALRMEYGRATRIAAYLGQAVALLFGLLGLFSNPFLVFIALFVWIGAAQESGMVQTRLALSGMPVSTAMIREFHTLHAQDPLARAIELILGGSQHDFPVIEDDRVVGILTRSDLVKALAQQSQQTPVADVMTRKFAEVDAHDMLESAFVRLQESACPAMPVLRQGRLVGLLTTENLSEFLMIESALKQRGAALPPSTHL